MKPKREAIMGALVEKLKATRFAEPVNGKTSWAKVSRRLALWGETPKSQRPALYIAERREAVSYQSENAPPKTTLEADLFVYIDSSDKRGTPARDLNVIMDAIAASLAPAPGESGRQTLGGLASHCRIEGQVLKDPGDLDGDGLLWVPLKILAV